MNDVAPGAAGPAPDPQAVPWGRVTLVGAGPGDPELLTLKAARVLANAELVLYDHLVSEAVLAHIAPGAERIYVGKRSRDHTLPQEGIIELMVQFARQGRSVVRLKGGDPFVFGRGGEEAEGLAAAGIACDTIPGISAAQGAAAATGIPLTHRETAGMLVYATGHLQGAQEDRTVQLDWSALARPWQTVVIYMGVATLPVVCEQLVAHGLPATTPAALIERATLPGQRCIVGTVDTLPGLAVRYGVKPPALIMIGEAVGRQILPPGGGDVVSAAGVAD